MVLIPDLREVWPPSWVFIHSRCYVYLCTWFMSDNHLHEKKKNCSNYIILCILLRDMREKHHPGCTERHNKHRLAENANTRPWLITDSNCCELHLCCILFSMICKNEVQVAMSCRFPRYVTGVEDIQPENVLFLDAKELDNVKKCWGVGVAKVCRHHRYRRYASKRN